MKTKLFLSVLFFLCPLRELTEKADIISSPGRSVSAKMAKKCKNCDECGQKMYKLLFLAVNAVNVVKKHIHR